MRLSPSADPRNLLPSRAHPEHRQTRKQLEKEHPFSFAQVATLGLIGLTLAWDIEKQVKKREERNDKEEAERTKRDDRDRDRDSCRGRGRREKEYHDRSPDSRRGHRAPERSRTGRKDDRGASESYARDPRRLQSLDYRGDTRRDFDGYRVQMPRHDIRDTYRYGSQYGDPRGLDLDGRRRSRRDSW
ncbi:hypothetical protein F5Y12DRAFT_374502 [Xylaria sp. FL1777]|nr:hypothetical protein F5Y12DRAFT_374502 [Xylaria sp. FL1777]